MTGQPNILYIITDEMRSTAMGCAGVENVLTPNLDCLAREGTCFTNAVTNTPVCSAARASLLTGLHVLTHGIVFCDRQLGTGFRSIAHCLDDAGYDCGYVGKWHLDSADRGVFVPPGPRRQGFDDFWAANNCNHNYMQAYYYRDDNPEPIWIDGYEPFEQTRLAAGYITRKARGDRPFCLFVSWSPPHCPYRMVPGKYLDQYPAESIELMPTAIEGRKQGETGVGGPGGEEDRFKRECVAGYYAHISALDECLGRLLETLEASGQADNTIVVFSSDHGCMLFNHNRGWKCKPWRESVGVPLVMRWPGHIPAGRLAGGPIGLVDHMPSLLGMVGTAVPEDVEGLDLSRYILGDDSAAPGSAFINHPLVPTYYSYPEWRGVVTHTHTYARTREKAWILYDDNADPLQTDNLANDPAHAALQGRLDAELQEWLVRTRDPFEPSAAVAEKYCPGHDPATLEIPFYENETIREARKRMSGETS